MFRNLNSFILLSLSISAISAHETGEEMTNVESDAYCGLSCFRNRIKYKNVACSEKPCTPSVRCGEHHERLVLEEAEQEYILHLHNEIRNQVASGNASCCGESSDMNVLSYDKELAFLASCWANGCWFSPKASHGRDFCRATTFSYYNGQNHIAFANHSLVDWSDRAHLKKAVDEWFSGIKYISNDIRQKYRYDKEEKYEYVAQIIWSDTRMIGCGRTKFSLGSYNGVSIVCNYAPGGNIPLSPIYNLGPACTFYPGFEGKKNKKYSHLCGEIRTSSEDTYEPPFELVGTRNAVSFAMIIITLMVEVYVY